MNRPQKTTEKDLSDDELKKKFEKAEVFSEFFIIKEIKKDIKECGEKK